MRQLTYDLFTTVDGYAFGKQSSAYFGLGGPDLFAWIEEQAAKPHVMLMGANTYRALSAFAGKVGDDPSSRMDELPKYVFSTTLRGPLSWANSELVNEDATTAVPRMKDEPGEEMRIIGSLSMAHNLMTNGLVDRIRLIWFPQILGATGAEPILRSLPDLDLTLTGTRVLDGRLVLAEYQLN